MKKYSKIVKIISGGQTGVDISALEWAKNKKIKTGGIAPKNFRTEKGQNEELKTVYHLNESKHYNYSQRTIQNIENSDGTLIFIFRTSPGSVFTFQECRRLRKNYIINPTPEKFIKWLNYNKISILNIAGNRESVAPGIGVQLKKLLDNSIKN